MFYHKRGHQEFTEEPEPEEPKAEEPKHHFSLGVIDSVEDAVTNAFHPHYSEHLSVEDMKHQRDENDHDQRR